MSLWPEIGAALILASGLLAWAQAPVPWIDVAEAAQFEGRRVTVTGWPEDIRHGDGWARFTLIQDGHAIPVYADEPPDLGLQVVNGHIERIDGRLVLLADGSPWTSSR